MAVLSDIITKTCVLYVLVQIMLVGDHLDIDYNRNTSGRYYMSCFLCVFFCCLFIQKSLKIYIQM